MGNMRDTDEKFSVILMTAVDKPYMGFIWEMAEHPFKEVFFFNKLYPIMLWIILSNFCQPSDKNLSTKRLLEIV